MIVDIYSHSAMATPESSQDKQLLGTYFKRFIQWDSDMVDGKPVYKVARKFYYPDPKGRHLRFHINILQDFADFLAQSGVTHKELKVNVHRAELSNEFMTDYKVIKLHTPREAQIPIIQHLMTRQSGKQVNVCGHQIQVPDNNRTVTLRPGGGKTFISLRVMADQGIRTLFMMRGGYLDRWAPEITESFKIKGAGLQMVQGSSALSAVMYEALEGNWKQTQVYLLSTDTYADYISHYERNGVSELFPIAPADFFQTLRIGSTVIDEGHQLPHRVMKFFSYLHVYRHTTLTATLDTMDRFMDKILSIMYPKDQRFSGPKEEPHIRVTAYRYQLQNPKWLRYTGYKGSYSHTAFEASLMKPQNKDLFREYIQMVADLLQEKYIKRDLDGTKALVFFATIEMCTKVRDVLAKTFPERKVVRYVGKDKMTVMDDADIIISTVLSAGTAVDIKNLLTSIMTTAMDSQQSNEQTVGRTRPVVLHPTEDPEFIYFMCSDITKHMDYHRNKERFFKGKVKEHGIEQSHITLGANRKDAQPTHYAGVSKNKTKGKGNKNYNPWGHNHHKGYSHQGYPHRR